MLSALLGSLQAPRRPCNDKEGEGGAGPILAARGDVAAEGEGGEARAAAGAAAGAAARCQIGEDMKSEGVGGLGRRSAVGDGCSHASRKDLSRECGRDDVPRTGRVGEASRYDVRGGERERAAGRGLGGVDVGRRGTSARVGRARDSFHQAASLLVACLLVASGEER